eukprot:81337_1
MLFSILSLLALSAISSNALLSSSYGTHAVEQMSEAISWGCSFQIEENNGTGTAQFNIEVTEPGHYTQYEKQSTGFVRTMDLGALTEGTHPVSASSTSVIVVIGDNSPEDISEEETFLQDRLIRTSIRDIPAFNRSFLVGELTEGTHPVNASSTSVILVGSLGVGFVLMAALGCCCVVPVCLQKYHRASQPRQEFNH